MRRSGLPAVCVFVLLAGAYSWIYTMEPAPRIQGDGYYTYLWAVSIAFDRDLDLTNQYNQCGDPWLLLRRRPSREGQWPHNTWSLGPSLVWAPMLAVARNLEPDVHHDDPRGRFGCVGRWANQALFGSVLMALFALFFTYLLARRHTGMWPALFGVLGIALCSTLPYYAAFLPSYSHAPAAFGAALFLERWDATRGSRTVKRWLLLGVLLGVAMLMRAQSALLAVAPLLEWIAGAREDLSRREHRRVVGRVLTGVLFVAVALVVFFPQLYVWKRTYGVWLALPQGPHYMRWTEPHIDGVLFGAAAGLLTFTPLMYLGVLGLIGGSVARKTRLVAGACTVILALFVYVNASVWDWWGSAGFGARRFTEITPLLGVGMAFAGAWLARRAERRPRRFAGWALAALVLPFALYNVGAMKGTANGHIVTQRDLRSDHYFRLATAEVSEDVEEHVGNPFAWPASLPFALIYDTEPRRYDLVRGFGAFYQEFETARVRAREDWDHVRPGRGAQIDYAADGFEEEPRTVLGRPAAITSGSRSRFLVPLFADDVSAFDITWLATLPVDAPARERREEPAIVAITWNGHPVAQADAPTRWMTMRFDMPPGVAEVGVNEVWLDIAHGPVAIESIRFRQLPIPDDPNRMRDWFDLHGVEP